MTQIPPPPVLFPLIDLCEHLPGKLATVEVIESPEDLGLCFPGSNLNSLFGTTRRLYDRNGALIRIKGFKSPTNFTLFERIRSIISPFSVSRTVHVELEEEGPSSPEKFRNQVVAFLKADPGDHLLQFRKEKEWLEGLEERTRFPDLFDFVVDGIMPSNEGFDQDEAESV